MKRPEWVDTAIGEGLQAIVAANPEMKIYPIPSSAAPVGFGLWRVARHSDWRTRVVWGEKRAYRLMHAWAK